MRRRRSLGQSMVEFALIAPSLLLLTVGLADFARAFYYFTDLNTAANEGTRQAVLYANRATNTSSATTPTSSQTVGVVPAIKNVAFGLPVIYHDSTSLSSPPSYGTYAPPGAGQQVGSVKLNSNAQPNVIYVFVWQEGDSALSPRWSCPSCNDGHEVRTAGHNTVIVDAQVRFAPFTTLAGGINFSVPLEAKSVAREEW